MNFNSDGSIYRPQMNPKFVKAVLKKREAAKLRLANRHLGKDIPAEHKPEPSGHVAFDRICNRICKVFKVDFNDIKFGHDDQTYDQRAIFIRQCIIYWTLRMTHYSVNSVVRLMGGCDRSTITYAAEAYPKKRLAMHKHLRKIY